MEETALGTDVRMYGCTKVRRYGGTESKASKCSVQDTGHGPHLSAREELVALAVPEGAGGGDDVGHGCAAIGEDAAHERAGEVDSLVIEGDVEGDEVR